MFGNFQIGDAALNIKVPERGTPSPHQEKKIHALKKLEGEDSFQKQSTSEHLGEFPQRVVMSG